MKLALLSIICLIMSFLSSAQNLFLFEQAGKYGYHNEEGKIIIEPIYQEAKVFSEGLVAVELNDRWGFIDTVGKVVFPFVYLKTGDYGFMNGIALVETEKGVQFLSKSGVLYDKDPELISESPNIWRVYKSVDEKNEIVKYGLMDSIGKEILPVLFDEIVNEYGQIEVYFDNRKAVFNSINNQINNELYQLQTSDEKYGFQDLYGNIKIKPTYQMVNDFSEGLAAVLLNDRWGYIDTIGHVVFPMVYEAVDKFRFGMAAVATDKGEQYLSRSGELYDRDPELLSENPILWSVPKMLDKKDKKFKNGLIDASGKEVLPILFDNIVNENGQIVVYVEGRKAEFFLENKEIKKELYELKNSKRKYGFQDLFGNVVIKPKYDQILEVWPSFAIATFKGRQVLVRFKDKSEYTYDQIDVPLIDVSPTKLTVSLNGKKGMIDTTGKLLIPILYDDLVESQYDRYQLYGVVVNLNDKYGIVDRTGKEITPIIYDQISFDFDGHEICKYASALKNGKWGCLDNKTGKELIPTKYDKIEFVAIAGESNFDTTDIAHVKYCLIKIGNKIDTIFSYDDYEKRNKDESWEIIDQRKLNDSLVQYVIFGGGKWGLVDLNGIELTPIKYDELRSYFHEEMLPVNIDDKWGFINNKGEEIIPVIYEAVEHFHKGKAQVRLGERYFYIDKNGNKTE